jgi:hypothetical protein
MFETQKLVDRQCSVVHGGEEAGLQFQVSPIPARPKFGLVFGDEEAGVIRRSSDENGENRIGQRWPPNESGSWQAECRCQSGSTIRSKV